MTKNQKVKIKMGLTYVGIAVASIATVLVINKVNN